MSYRHEIVGKYFLLARPVYIWDAFILAESNLQCSLTPTSFGSYGTIPPWLWQTAEWPCPIKVDVIAVTMLLQKRGRWCAAHVDVAWKIHRHKVVKAYDATTSLRAGRNASKLSDAGLKVLPFGPSHLGLSANSTAMGRGDVRSTMHPQGRYTSQHLTI